MSMCICIALFANELLYGSEAWRVKQENVIRLERNDARMVTWMCNVSPGDRISAEEIRDRLKLKGISEYLQDRSLQ